METFKTDRATESSHFGGKRAIVMKPGEKNSLTLVWGALLHLAVLVGSDPQFVMKYVPVILY